jgi:hypothetical protein
VLRAHLTLFHHLPPSIEGELLSRLREETKAPAPRAEIAEPYSLGNGVAYRVRSPELAAVRDRLADAFTGLLTPQDQAGWRPHVTIQNKVAPAEARALLATLSAFRPRPLAISGLAAWRYLGGPWAPIKAFHFGGGHAMTPPA